MVSSYFQLAPRLSLGGINDLIEIINQILNIYISKLLKYSSLDLFFEEVNLCYLFLCFVLFGGGVLLKETNNNNKYSIVILENVE